jgi:hypothetical protein
MDEAFAANEYYLPLGYNDNKITLLARDPNWLYAYWELSTEKRSEFIREFGNDILEKSVPVIKVTNVSKNSNFFVRINDFSNSWYISVPDTNSLYIAEIGRKVSDKFFINLAESNYISTPANDISKNNAAYFIDYNTLKDGKPDLESGSIYKTFNSESNSEFKIGISSPELIGIDFEKSHIGMSSAELFEINISKHIGISSYGFY